MKFKINKEEINNIVLSKDDVPKDGVCEYIDEPGNQHFKLLAWLSLQFRNVDIFDIGTHRGASSSALAYNPYNRVLSFDISLSKLARRKTNCEYYEQNLLDIEVLKTWEDRILESPLIFLDTEPHEGIMEYNFYSWLKKKNYKGILIIDDIWYFKNMRDNLWSKIELNKYDLTHVGHWSGTGMVDFSDQNIKNESDNWTLVTAYFDLTKEPDASVEINNRPMSHYLSTANSTMCVEQNLVIFCEENTKIILDSLRPLHLKHKTKYIICGFNDFELVVKNRKIIARNRMNKPYHFDNRNTPSYYLFCMLRYVMIDQIIDENPFNSTHFAWINICIERMGWKNVANLNNALSLNRDKFSTCYIDYQPKELVQNYQEYFKYGRCGMCSGFFTGRSDYFKQFNKLMIESFYECLNQGYGHADEQLYSIVYFKNPSIFELYYGDYQQMITNYISVIDNIESPIINIIRNAFIHKNYQICLDGCLKVLPSYNKIPSHLLDSFLKYITISAVCTNKLEVLDIIAQKFI
jgi:hypothetical protein